MRTAPPAVGRRPEATDLEREWRATETVERLERPHGRVAASALAAAAGGAATAYGAWAGDLSTSAQVALAIAVSGLTMAVVPLALRGATTRVHLLVVIAAFLSAGAAAIHFAVIQDHFDEWWGYGAFFVASGIAQLAWSLLVVAAPYRLLFRLGVLGNALIVAVWIVTRTYGTIVGPGASEPEPAGEADVLATAFEGVIVAAALFTAGRGLPRAQTLRNAAYVVGAVALALTALGLQAALDAA